MKTEVEVDLFDLSDTIKTLQWLYDNIDKEAEAILEEVVKKGETYLDAQYASRHKDSNITDISTDYKKTSDGYELKAYGEDVVYEEFGTGDEGENNPHPIKSKYNLNDYNSGMYIRDVSSVDRESYTYEDLQEIGISSGEFWRYEKDGILHYTQGVPAGQEMWNTRNYIIKELPKIAKKRGKMINERIAKSVKR